MLEHSGTNGNWLGGNAIGLAADLSTALGNGGFGIDIRKASDSNGPASTIIGGVSGSGNLIGYNGNSGIHVYADGGGTQISHNIIGSNTGDGVYIHDSSGVVVGNNWIGSNTIGGVRVVGASAAGNLIWPNAIWDNGGKGIILQNGANFGILPPAITSAYPSGASGTGACASCTVALYSDADDEGQVYHGTTAADSAGNWTFFGLLIGPNVTATTIDISGNTSEFSTPVRLKYQVFLPMAMKKY